MSLQRMLQPEQGGRRGGTAIPSRNTAGADVFSLPRSIGNTAFTGMVQRKCAECEEEAEEKQQKPQRKAKDNAEAPAKVEAAVSGGGRALDTPTRRFMESRMGHDFSNVRVHTDSRAADSAQSINALAYTTGNHIVFGSEQYSPQTRQGQKLLAHELTHVVQQRSAPARVQRQAFDEEEEGTDKPSCIREIKGPEFESVRQPGVLSIIELARRGASHAMR